MNEYIQAIYEIAVSNNKFLIATEQRLINIEAKLDALLKANSTVPAKELSHQVAAPKEYPQSAEESVAE
jgi:hypothetical protein